MRGRWTRVLVAVTVVGLLGCSTGPSAEEVAAEQARVQTEERERRETEERERREAEEQAERERVAAEEQAERERVAAEEQAERERIEAEERAERERVAAEEQAERERIEAEERAAEEARRAEQERRDRVHTTQQRLQELGYLVGAADGEQGQQTTAAVMAFQAVNGLQVDGVIGPQTLGALQSPTAPTLRGGPDHRVEVDLDRQVLHLVEGGNRVVTMKVSSGNGAPYEWSDGTPAVGDTPVGTYRIERRIRGLRESNLGLGTLYDPMYFYLGYAIHGSNSVPAGPASHGCVRVSRADAVWLFDRVPDGTTVQLYGGRHVFSP